MESFLGIKKKNNKNKNNKSYYEYLWRKKFLQKSISSNNLLFKYYDKNGNNQIILNDFLKKSNSCLLKDYNFNTLKKSKKIDKNNITNLKIDYKKKGNSISFEEEKEYSIEGEIDNEENIKTYKKKKAKKIIKRKYISLNQNSETIYKTKNNSKSKINSYNNEKPLYTDYMVKRLPYIKIKKELNKIKNKSKLINSTLKDINHNMKKKISLNIKDLFFTNNNQKILNKSFKSENISVKKLANKSKALKIGKMIRVSKKMLNQAIKLENKTIQDNIITNNETPAKKIIKRNIYYNNVNNPEYTISSYNNINKNKDKPKLRSMNSNKILKNNNIYPTSYNISKDNSGYNLNQKKIKKNSYTIIHNSISKLNLIQNISNIYVTKSYFEEPKNVYIKPKNINAKKGKIKNMILKIKGNKNIDINKNIESKSEKENSLNYYYL